MSRTLADATLAQASDMIEAHLGLHFPQTRWNELERGLIGAARELDKAQTAELLEWLSAGKLTHRDIEILASHLTIGETYFFRERAVFDALETQIFPELIRRAGASKRLRIWCAGCCTGEEPYSIAMLLERLLPDIDNWNLLILATDINPQFLRQATRGLYKEWSFREPGEEIKQRFFTTPEPGRYVVKPHTRERVTFAHLNLAEDAYPSLLNHTNAMDLILCRNVLMYFSGEVMKQVIDRFYRSLVEGGSLVVSVTETSQQLFRQFQTLHFGNAVFYRKLPADQNTRVARVTGEAPIADPVPAPTRSLFSLRRPRQSKRANDRAAARPKPAGDEQALALYRQGRYGEAELLAGQLLQQQPTAALLALRARIAANQGQLPQALDWCDQSLALEKMNPLHHHLRATILEELGQPDEAMVALRKALYLDPEFVLAHFTLGHLAWRQQQLVQARKHFANVLALLGKRADDEELAEFDGLTTGRLADITRTLNEAVN